jgi:hypothetical protein
MRRSCQKYCKEFYLLEVPTKTCRTAPQIYYHSVHLSFHIPVLPVACHSLLTFSFLFALLHFSPFLSLLFPKPLSLSF